jgi:hypothetical protein
VFGDHDGMNFMFRLWIVGLWFDGADFYFDVNIYDFVKTHSVAVDLFVENHCPSR